MQNASFPYLINDAQGSRVASAEHIETALQLMRTLPSAKVVVRAADGVELARIVPPGSRSLPKPAWMS